MRHWTVHKRKRSFTIKCICCDNFDIEREGGGSAGFYRYKCKCSNIQFQVHRETEEVRVSMSKITSTLHIPFIPDNAAPYFTICQQISNKSGTGTITPWSAEKHTTTFKAFHSIIFFLTLLCNRLSATHNLELHNVWMNAIIPLAVPPFVADFKPTCRFCNNSDNIKRIGLVRPVVERNRCWFQCDKCKAYTTAIVCD